MLQHQQAGQPRELELHGVHTVQCVMAPCTGKVRNPITFVTLLPWQLCCDHAKMQIHALFNRSNTWWHATQLGTATVYTTGVGGSSAYAPVFPAQHKITLHVQATAAAAYWRSAACTHHVPLRVHTLYHTPSNNMLLETGHRYPRAVLGTSANLHMPSVYMQRSNCSWLQQTRQPLAWAQAGGAAGHTCHSGVQAHINATAGCDKASQYKFYGQHHRAPAHS